MVIERKLCNLFYNIVVGVSGKHNHSFCFISDMLRIIFFTVLIACEPVTIIIAWFRLRLFTYFILFFIFFFIFLCCLLNRLCIFYLLWFRQLWFFYCNFWLCFDRWWFRYNRWFICRYLDSWRGRFNWRVLFCNILIGISWFNSFLFFFDWFWFFNKL